MQYTSSQDSIVLAIRLSLARVNKSQAWLCGQLGESPFWLSRRMNGQRFTTDDLDRIAGVFETDLAGLLETARAVA